MNGVELIVDKFKQATTTCSYDARQHPCPTRDTVVRTTAVADSQTVLLSRDCQSRSASLDTALTLAYTLREGPSADALLHILAHRIRLHSNC